MAIRGNKNKTPQSKPEIVELKTKLIRHFTFDDSSLYYMDNDFTKEAIRALLKTAAIEKIMYVVDEDTQDKKLLAVLDEIDGHSLLDHGIDINLKVKDMPDEINLVGDNIVINCDYDTIEKPDLGNNSTFMAASHIRFHGGAKSLKNAQPTKIGSDVIIGANVYLPGSGLQILDGAIVLDFDGMFVDNVVIGPGVYIHSGYNTKGKISREELFVSSGPSNIIQRESTVKGNIVMQGYTTIPSYTDITGNVPLIFSSTVMDKLRIKLFEERFSIKEALT